MQVKIRYAFKSRNNGKIEFRYANIEEIENGKVAEFKAELVDFDLIGRDQYIGMHDVNGREVYENDLDRIGWKVSYVDDGNEGDNDGASDGLETGWYTERGNFESYGLITYNCAKNCADGELNICWNIYENPELRR